MSLWRKRNVQHNEQKPDHLVNILTNLSIKSEQKHDNLSNSLDLLHDLSIKSEDLSIKSEEAMREVQRLGQEIQPDVKQSLITEPVAYINIEKRRLEWAHDYMSWDTPTVVNLPRIPLYTTLQPAPQGEPVAWMHPDGRLWTFGRGLEKATFTIPLYTTLQQRPWVGLTDEEIRECFAHVEGVTVSEAVILISVVRTTQAALKEKNT